MVRTLNNVCVVLAVVLLASLQYTVFGADVFWIGTSGNWEDPSNWSNNSTITAADNVFLTGSGATNYTVFLPVVAISVNSLYIGKSNSTSSVTLQGLNGTVVSVQTTFQFSRGTVNNVALSASHISTTSNCELDGMCNDKFFLNNTVISSADKGFYVNAPIFVDASSVIMAEIIYVNANINAGSPNTAQLRVLETLNVSVNHVSIGMQIVAETASNLVSGQFVVAHNATLTVYGDLDNINFHITVYDQSTITVHSDYILTNYGTITLTGASQLNVGALVNYFEVTLDTSTMAVHREFSQDAFSTGDEQLLECDNCYLTGNSTLYIMSGTFKLADANVFNNVIVDGTDSILYVYTPYNHITGNLTVSTNATMQFVIQQGEETIPMISLDGFLSANQTFLNVTDTFSAQDTLPANGTRYNLISNNEKGIQAVNFTNALLNVLGTDEMELVLVFDNTTMAVVVNRLYFTKYIVPVWLIVVLVVGVTAVTVVVGAVISVFVRRRMKYSSL